MSDYLYVSYSDADYNAYLGQIDLSDGTTVKSLDGQLYPRLLTPNGLYVDNVGNDTIEKRDPTDLSLIWEFSPYSAPLYFAADGEGGIYYGRAGNFGTNIVKLDAATGNEEWRTGFFDSSDSGNGQDLTYSKETGYLYVTADPYEVEEMGKIDPSDGSIVARKNPEFIRYVQAASDGNIYGFGLGDVHRLDGDMNLLKSISPNLPDTYPTVDGDGNSYHLGSGGIKRVDHSAMNSSTSPTSSDLKGDIVVGGGAVTNDYGDITRVDSDGNTVWTRSFNNVDDENLVASPNGYAYPDAWSTTVTKSTSATQVASSSAQRTASGAIADSASATTLASSATPQTPSGTSTADVTATEATSSTTQQTPGATGLASITATETASTATMPTVSADRGRLANATTTGASTTMESPTGVTGWTAVASDVVASGGLATPGVIESVDTTPGVYSLLSDFDNGGIRDVALSDGTTSSVTATKTVYSDGHTQDETGALYVTGSGSLVKYADDGTQQWETAESNTYYSAPVVTDRGYIYYIERPGSADDRLVKADRDTGDVVWDVPAGNPDSSSYTLEVDAGNELYYHDSGNAIRSYDVSDGSTQWFSESGHQTFTVGPDGTIYASDEVSGDKNFVEIDPSDGTESSPIFTLSGTIYDIQADDSGKLYLVRYNNSNYSLETYSSGGSQQWSHTMSGSPQTQFALNVDGSVTYKTDVSGTKHHVRVDSSGTETWDVSRPYNFGLIRPPKYGANGAAWTPTTTAHPSPMNVSASSSSSTPTTDGIVVSSATPTPGSTTMSGPVGTGGASAGVASVASSSGLFTPDPNGQTGASSVQISASSEPNTPASTGVASSTANPYPSSTSMRVAVRSAAVSATGSIIEATSALQTATGSPGRRASATTVDASASVETPSIGRLRVDVGTDASASTTMELPTVDIGVTASDSTYEAVADPRVPLIGLYATAQKYGAQGETNQAISFAPRTTALEGDGPAIEFTGRGSGPNGVDIDSSKE